jgi:hypothetical protein
VYDPPMTFTILSDRWVGNTGCPAKSSTKGGHPTGTYNLTQDPNHGGTYYSPYFDKGLRADYSRLHSENSCYHSVQFCHKRQKNSNTQVFFLPVVLYGCETWTFAIRGEHRRSWRTNC